MASAFYIPKVGTGDLADIIEKNRTQDHKIALLNNAALGNASSFSTNTIVPFSSSTLAIGCNPGTTDIQIGCAGTTQRISLGSINGGATSIDIGGPGDTVLIQGSSVTNNTTTLDVANKFITLNDGGAASSGFSVGIKVEENGVATGHVMTASDRASWELKIPSSGAVCRINQSLATADSPSFLG